MLGSVALVYAPDQLLADLAREVEVDVRYRCERLIQEAAEEEARGDGIDVRQPHQVADDGRHRGAAPPPGERDQPQLFGEPPLRLDAVLGARGIALLEARSAQFGERPGRTLLRSPA